MSRRAALQAGAVGLLGLGMGHLNELRALGVPFQAGAPKAKSVLFIFLSGGLSHIDSLDPKPDAPDSVRGPFRPIATRTPGLFLSEHLPLLAQRSQDWALCRSLATKTDDHELGHQVILSGRVEPPPGFNPNQPQATDWPASAALANYAARGRHNLPPAVVLPEKMIRTDTLRPRPGQFAGLLTRIMHPVGQERLVEEHKAIDHHDLCRLAMSGQRKQTAPSGTGRRRR